MNNINMAFGRLLRAKRLAMKFSQAGFASKLQLPQTTISRVEQGQRGVTLPELLSVAGACQCSVSDLLGELAAFTPKVFPAPSAQAAPGRTTCAVRADCGQPSFTPAFSIAYASEEAMLAQLARHGIRFQGAPTQPAFATLPVEEVILAALHFADEPRVFEALPALTLKNTPLLDWNKLVAGAYALQLQNRLGMVVAAALQLRDAAKGVDKNTWEALRAAHEALAAGKLDRDEVVGPRPKTKEGVALLRERTPGWLSFWHGMGSADLKSFQRYLPQ